MKIPRGQSWLLGSIILPFVVFRRGKPDRWMFMSSNRCIRFTDTLRWSL